MRLLSGLMVVSLLSLAGAGCSHGTVSELPTTPTPNVIISTLTVTPVGGGSILEGLTVPITSSGGFPATGATLGAFAQYTDGSGKYVEAAWTSSNSQVIAIEGGALVAKGRGTATVTASFEGKTASETFTVQPGIAGTWSGTYTVEDCAAGGGSIHELICFPMDAGRTPGAFAAGVVAPVTLVISQTGNDLTATAQFGDLRGVLTGRDRGQNFLSLTGTLTAAASTMSVVLWDTRVRGDVMDGVIGFEMRIGGIASHAQVSARFDQVTRR
jgi:hypothetical protein